MILVFALGVALAGPLGWLLADFRADSRCRDNHFTVDQISPDMVRVLDRMQADYAALGREAM